jgi:hypothetical protein
MLAVQFHGRKVTVSVIQLHVEDHTPYLASHMKKALRHLEEDDRLCVDPCKQGGEKRRKTTFPEGVVVTFPKNF